MKVFVFNFIKNEAREFKIQVGFLFNVLMNSFQNLPTKYIIEGNIMKNGTKAAFLDLRS